MQPLAPRPAAHPAPDVLRLRGVLSQAWSLLAPRGDLLQALPSELYGYEMAHLRLADRVLYVVNNAADARRVLVDEAESFPKAPFFATALRPLVGDGVFVSNGETWRRRRAAIRPALSHVALERSFAQMAAAVDAAQVRLDAVASRGAVIGLDAEMSHITADVIHRTMFSQPIAPQDARLVFDSFAQLQRLSDQLAPRALLTRRRRLEPTDGAAVSAVGAKIRGVISRGLDARRRMIEAGETPPQDMTQALIDARDPVTGQALDHDALIDEMAVFFLAGHETSASALTWSLYMAFTAPGVAAKIRAEHAAVSGGEGRIAFEDAQARLPYTRRVLREILRLYPPVGFLARTPTQPVQMRRWRLMPGDLVIVSPWLLGRHRKLWPSPDAFDPDRTAAGEPEAPAGAELAFGVGPRSCPGAAFARLESALILARLTARYDLSFPARRAPVPAARLTIRPRTPILCRVALR